MQLLKQQLNCVEQHHQQFEFQRGHAAVAGGPGDRGRPIRREHSRGRHGGTQPPSPDMTGLGDGRLWSQAETPHPDTTGDFDGKMPIPSYYPKPPPGLEGIQATFTPMAKGCVPSAQTQRLDVQFVRRLARELGSNGWADCTPLAQTQRPAEPGCAAVAEAPAGSAAIAREPVTVTPAGSAAVAEEPDVRKCAPQSAGTSRPLDDQTAGKGKGKTNSNKANRRPAWISDPDKVSSDALLAQGFFLKGGHSCQYALQDPVVFCNYEHCGGGGEMNYEHFAKLKLSDRSYDQHNLALKACREHAPSGKAFPRQPIMLHAVYHAKTGQEFYVCKDGDPEKNGCGIGRSCSGNFGETR